jgi:hypothetical protein
MKRIILTSLVICISGFFANAQDAKPSLMIVPADNWFARNYYFNTYTLQGKRIRVNDYKRAFQEDSDIKLLIEAFEAKMRERGFEVTNYEKYLNSIITHQPDISLNISETNDTTLTTCPIYELWKHTKSDFVVTIDYYIRKEPNGRTVFFEITQGNHFNYPDFSVDVNKHYLLDSCSNDGESVAKLFDCAMSKHLKQLGNAISGYNRKKSGFGYIYFTILCNGEWDDYKDKTTTGGYQFDYDVMRDFLKWFQMHGSRTVESDFYQSPVNNHETYKLYVNGPKELNTIVFVTQLNKFIRDISDGFGIISKIIVQNLDDVILILDEKKK